MEFGIKLPEGVKPPAGGIDLVALEKAVEDARKDLVETGRTFESLAASDAKVITRYIEENMPVRGRDLAVIEGAVRGRIGAVGGGEVATVAVVGAVVGAVVAAVVAAAGISQELREAVVRPEFGIEGLTRTSRGLTVHGPNGLRIEGLSIEDVATLITRIR
ncbi:MAG: hypothetical protein ABIO70_16105 [Pseudomonadota bacterium]